MINQEPPNWWGCRGRGDNRLSLLRLVHNDTLDIDTAALLWLMVEHKCSLIVAAGPQLAGKTTLLSAAIEMAPPRFDRVYTRGRDEDFSFLSQTRPETTYIMVPELSDHTAAYLWGDKVKTLFDALETGYSMAATMHADSPEQVIGLLAAAPANVPTDLMGNVGIVVNIHMDYGDRDMTRRVDRVTLVRSQGDLQTLARRCGADSRLTLDRSPEATSVLGERLGLPSSRLGTELTQRSDTLRSWLERGDTGAEAIRQLVAENYSSASG